MAEEQYMLEGRDHILVNCGPQASTAEPGAEQVPKTRGFTG